VLDVEKGTPAEDAGLKKGDIIQEIEGKRIRQYEDWREALDRVRPDDTVVLFINRQGKKFFLALKP
jgi:serine protease Do